MQGTVRSTYGFRLQIEFDEETAQVDTAQITGMYEFCLLRRGMGFWKEAVSGAVHRSEDSPWCTVKW
jgi:hypothetical protein